MNRQNSPYVCHVFVCVNDRKGERKSCADGQGGLAIKELLKNEAAKRGWGGRVRVSQCGCMGLCQKGPNVMLYPQGIWFSEVAPALAPDILDVIEKLIATKAP